ncbi:MAG TPA: biotin/lipoyl-containing protein, partial [Ilumatobacteraceae bacterium]
TEMITGLDLVRMQIEVAQGAPLPPDVIDARINGHAIEARLYAEDVAAGFVPTSGPVHRLHIPTAAGLRVDSGYEDGSAVSTFYDAMLSKVIAWAPTRTEAITVLADALSRAEIHGVVTNRDLLVNTLRSDEFVAGQTDTGFFDRHDLDVLGVAADAAAVAEVHAIAAALARPSAVPGAASPHPAGLPRGWRNVGGRRATTELLRGGESLSVAVVRDRDGVMASVNGRPPVAVRVIAATDDTVELELLGVRHRVRLHRVGHHLYADSMAGATDLVAVERFPLPDAHVAHGSLLSPMPGTVVAVHAVVGQDVIAGQVLIALEAMKMEHSIKAPLAGAVVEVRVAVGDQVESGQVLIVVGDASDASEEG